MGDPTSTLAEIADHLFWERAAELGLIDSVGGMEWMRRHAGTPLISDSWLGEHERILKEHTATPVHTPVVTPADVALGLRPRDWKDQARLTAPGPTEQGVAAALECGDVFTYVGAFCWYAAYSDPVAAPYVGRVLLTVYDTTESREQEPGPIALRLHADQEVLVASMDRTAIEVRSPDADA